MNLSKKIGGLVGPTILAMVAAEYPLVQPHLYDTQIPPVVYLSGNLMFVGGLAIVRAHHHWRRDWTALITLTGWLLLLVGLFRMFAASGYPQEYANANPKAVMIIQGILLIAGSIITIKSYSRSS